MKAVTRREGKRAIEALERRSRYLEHQRELRARAAIHYINAELKALSIALDLMREKFGPEEEEGDD